mmetsp:Transcript_98082/g.299853  ORF Transcript_98082/g.299853 Transcript_98082/m.299853 type:complete len:240 (-) Transcript_98082:7746-8465(-)
MVAAYANVLQPQRRHHPAEAHDLHGRRRLLLRLRVPRHRRQARADPAHGQVLPHAYAGAAHAPRGESLRPRRNGQNGVGESVGQHDGPIRLGLLLRRGLRLQGNGAHIRRLVPGWRVGLLRRVQPARGADSVGGERAGVDNPNGLEGRQKGNRNLGQAREAQHQCGHFRDDEPWLRGALQPPGQLEAAIPRNGNDHAGQNAHRTSEPFQPRISECRAVGGKGRVFVRPVQGSVVVAAAL